MRGQVLEINTADTDKAMRVLNDAWKKDRALFDEIALYGTQIHAVVPDAESFKYPIMTLLEGEGIEVRGIEWIAPTLEDVFISSVKPREE
jgi:hypothetical protein